MSCMLMFYKPYSLVHSKVVTINWVNNRFFKSTNYKTGLK